MIFIFFILFFSASCIAMQPTNTSALSEAAITSSVQLQLYAHEVTYIRSSLWSIKGLLVKYYNSGIQNQKALDAHNDNIKHGYIQIIEESNKACDALSRKDLVSLKDHIMTAHRHFAQLNKEAAHFKEILAKRYPDSKM